MEKLPRLNPADARTKTLSMAANNFYFFLPFFNDQANNLFFLMTARCFLCNRLTILFNLNSFAVILGKGFKHGCVTLKKFLIIEILYNLVCDYINIPVYR